MFMEGDSISSTCQFFPLCSIDSMHPNQNPAGYFAHIDKLIRKFLWRGQRHRTGNTILKEEKRLVAWHYRTSGLSINLRQSRQYGTGERIDRQVNGTKEKAQKQTSINTANRFMQWTESNTLEQRSLFDKWCWNIWTFTWGKMNLDTDLMPFTAN